jgi:hypothetical protein
MPRIEFVTVYDRIEILSLLPILTCSILHVGFPVLQVSSLVYSLVSQFECNFQSINLNAIFNSMFEFSISHFIFLVYVRMCF